MSLEEGLKAFKFGRFAEAIALLQDYCDSCEAAGTVGSRSYMQAQMSLVKAHLSSDEQEKAIAICRSLLNVDNTALKIWASQTLSKMVPPDSIQSESEEPDTHTPDAPGSRASSKTNPNLSSNVAQTRSGSRPSTSAARSTPSRQPAPVRQDTPQPSYSIAHSGASMIGGAFTEVLLKFLIRRGLALLFLLPLWFIRGYLFGGSSTTPVGEATPLHQAAGQGNVTQVQQLLAQGADINARDAGGRTPLFWAASGCVFEIPDESYGATCAPNPTHAQVTVLLLSNGADVDIQDVNEETPLHWAAGLGIQETAKPLLDKGADLNAKDAYGATPLAVARYEENQGMITYLQNLGAQE